MNDTLENFIIANSPDGGFLQSVYWQKFQESVGRKTYNLEEGDKDGNTTILANIVVHRLPIVGNYFYVPRGPIFEKSQIQNPNIQINPKSQIQIFFNKLINLGKQNNIGWIRIEPNSERELNLIKENLPEGLKIKKSSVDMQPKEILVMDVAKSEEELLAGMKQKTRYNIRLSQKKDVRVTHNVERVTQNNIGEFLRLVKITAERDRIAAHPESHYRKMLETIPPEILKLYVAEYNGKIIAANLVLFFGKTATYMHGASDNIHRDVMAPYLLQWRQILDAKRAGCVRYDFGGVKTWNMEHGAWNKSWEGITRFKMGFAPSIEPIKFPGCYDIILKPAKYNLYRFIQKIKRIF